MSKTLTSKISHFIRTHHLISHGQTVIVGLSGGPDSLFLLHVLYELKDEYNLTLIAAHLDHGWRKNSADDLMFCKHVAEQLGVIFVSAHATEIQLSKPTRSSLEEQGRALRRTFFKQIAAHNPNSCIALGHHADDQQETFFIRLLRGSGVTGLAGIKPRDGMFIHPLLSCTKQDVVQTLETNGIRFLVDPTNENEQFLRNRIRLNVIPALRQCDMRFDESLRRTMENLRETDDFLEEHAQELFTLCTHRSHEKLWLSLEKFGEQHHFMQKKMLLHWLIHEQVSFTPSSALFHEVLQFFKNSKSNQHTFYGTWHIVKKGQYVTIEQ